MRITLNVTKNNLPRIEAQFDDGVADVINHGILTAIEAADPLTRVDTGALIGNKVIDYASPGKFEGEIHWAQEYAEYQNAGTVYMDGTHFADEGAKAGHEDIVSGLADFAGRF